jgi:hypothetical protein
MGAGEGPGRTGGYERPLDDEGEPVYAKGFAPPGDDRKTSGIRDEVAKFAGRADFVQSGYWHSWPVGTFDVIVKLSMTAMLNQKVQRSMKVAVCTLGRRDEG